MGSSSVGSTHFSREPIAVIGFSAKLPGEAVTAQEFWELLLQGRSTVSEIPKERMHARAFWGLQQGRNDQINTTRGHFLTEDIGAFDAPFFSISPTESATMDPQQRGLLETVYLALENSGIGVEAIAGSNASVFTGVSMDDYRQMYAKDPEEVAQYGATGVASSLLSNRISWFYNLNGPSISIDTACSSSAVALDLACQNLISKEANLSIVAGCNLLIATDNWLLHSNMNMLADDGQSHAFDRRASGYGRGEGFTCLILKRVSDAVVAGDCIRAVIRSTHSNQNGYTSSAIVRTSQSAQEALTKEAYRKAGLDMEPTRFVEAHGTGTGTGDPMEANALGMIFRKSRTAQDPLFVGSLKTNIGHLEGASGLVSVIKAIMILEKGVIPPNFDHEHTNRRIDEQFLRIKFPTTPISWPALGLRRISVNSFGFGGSNSHVVLDDAFHFLAIHKMTGRHNTEDLQPKALSQTVSPFDTNGVRVASYGGRHLSGLSEAREQTLLIFSAFSDNCVKRNVEVYARYFANPKSFRKHDIQYLRNLAYTLYERRSLMSWRSFIVVEDAQDLMSLDSKISAPKMVASKPPKLCFAFTGQGAQWERMGLGLLVYEVFSSRLLEAERYLKTLGCPYSLISEIERHEGESRIHEPQYSQPACTALQIALVDLLKSFGIHPSVAVGHSSGEIAAAYCVGAITFESALKLAYFRGEQVNLLSKAKHTYGGMMAVALSGPQVQPYLDGLTQVYGACKVQIGCYNSESNLTLTGDAEQLDYLKDLLATTGVKVHRLKVNVAYHSSQMLNLASSYEARVDTLEPGLSKASQGVIMISSVSARPVSEDELRHTAYWAKNLVEPVRFSEAFASICSNQSDPYKLKIDHSHLKLSKTDIVIEVGPHSALRGPIYEIIASTKSNTSIQYLPTNIRRSLGSRVLVELAGNLYCSGYPVDLKQVNDPKGSKYSNTLLVDLPGYSFDHSTTYWYESRISRNIRLNPESEAIFLGRRVADWNPLDARWRMFVGQSLPSWARDHSVQNQNLYPASGMLIMAIAAAMNMADKDRSISGVRVSDVMFRAPIRLPYKAKIEVQTALRPLRKFEKSIGSHVNSSETSWSFQIYSCIDSRDTWINNSDGIVSVEYRGTEADHEGQTKYSDLEAFQDGNVEEKNNSEMNTAELYAALQGHGYDFGPAFRRVSQIWLSGTEAFGTINMLGDQGELKLDSDLCIHPAELDGLFHSILALIIGQSSKRNTTPVPHRLHTLWISRELLKKSETMNQIQNLEFAARSLPRTREPEGSVIAVEKVTKARMIMVDGLSLAAVAWEEGAAEPSHQFPECHYINWRPSANLQTNEQVACLSHDSEKLPPGAAKACEDIDQTIESFVRDIANEFECLDTGTLEEPLRTYFRWLLRKNNQLEAGDHTEPSTKVKTSTLVKFSDKSYDSTSAQSCLGELIVRVGRKLSQILRGEIDPLALIFRDDLMTRLYNELTTSGTHVNAACKYLSLLAYETPGLKVLEIGAGTGATTEHILRALCHNRDFNGASPRETMYSRYDFTDISPAFFEKAQARFKDYPNFFTSTFDVEKEPGHQGFASHVYDVVVAANVLHATCDINQTLNHVWTLLKPGGKLILLEPTVKDPRAAFVMGLLPGVDLSCRWSPCFSTEEWSQLLSKNGFSGSKIVIDDYTNDLCHQESIIITTALRPPGCQQDRHIFILREDTQASNDLAVDLERGLARLGARVQGILQISDAASARDIKNITFISVLDLARPYLRTLDSSAFKSLQDLLRFARKLIWLKKGSSSGEPDYSVVDGLSRTLKAENAQLTFTTLALDSQGSLSHQQLAHILCVIERMECGDEIKSEVACEEVKEALQIARVMPDPELSGEIFRHLAPPAARKKPMSDDLRLSLTSLHLDSDSIFFSEVEPFSQHPHIKSIEIRAQAWSVSKDNLPCRPQETLVGVAGVITTVPIDDIEFRPGDRVCALISGPIATHIQLAPSCLVKIPTRLSNEEAATVIEPFLAAYLGLDFRAIRKEDRLLVCHAACPVGQAAIQLAQHFGVDMVFASVDNYEEKAEMVELYKLCPENVLVLRDLQSDLSIFRRIQGTVDVIIDPSVFGSYQECWNWIAPFGCIIHFGSHEAYPERSRTRCSSKTITYLQLSLSDWIEQRPENVSKVVRKLMDLFSRGVLHPLRFDRRDLSETTKILQAHPDGYDMKPIVLSVRSGVQIEFTPLARPRHHFDGTATYVLAGGLGALGRILTKWMVDQGARYLLLISRSTPSPSAISFVEELSQHGACVKILQCDLYDSEKLRSGVRECCSCMPMIKGCIQAAMVLEDALFENMSYDAWKCVVRPKVDGSWNLHSILPSGMDFFVMLSSVSGIVGLIGQSNYATGNTYQEALAQHRCSTGEKAISIALGPFDTVGFLSKRQETTRTILDAEWVRSLQPEHLLALLDYYCNPATAQRQPHHASIIAGLKTPDSATVHSLKQTPQLRSPLFNHFLHAHQPNSDHASPKTHPPQADTLSSFRTALTTPHAADIAAHALAAKFSSLVPAATGIDVQRPMVPYGIDSLVALELQSWIAASFRADVTVFEITGGSSFADVGRTIAVNSPYRRFKVGRG